LIVVSQLGLIAVLDAHPTALPESDGAAAPAPAASVPSPEPATAAPTPPVPAEAAAAPVVAVSQAPAVDPAVAALCAPIAGKDPCGPDLELDGDGGYLNFFAQVESVLPSSFLTHDDGKIYDRTKVDLAGQLAAIKPLLARTRDLRLLTMQARLQILNKDLAGFAVSVSAAAQLLETSWDEVHPRPQGDDLSMRSTTIAALADMPTAIFPLQYAPLFEVPRVGVITYRALMIATGEVKPRGGEQKLAADAILNARGDAAPELLAVARARVAMVKSGLERIRDAFMMHAGSAGLDNILELIGKIQAFVDPAAVATAAAEPAGADEAIGAGSAAAGTAPGTGPASLAEASEALAAIASYYSRREPSSPTLPLVRQAHQLIGKSFIEVISILVPTHMDKAAFQIGADQVFELPVGKLSNLSADAVGAAAATASESTGTTARFQVDSRSQAVALLDQVQRFFRQSEPSSPVPMLCERARAFAERDFMAVLRDVLPKAALKNVGVEK